MSDTAPRRLRFSLLNLALLTTVIAMAIVIWRQAAEITGLRKLHSDAGFLSVTDREKFHAVFVPTYDELTWRWRVWLPKGRHYSLGVLCNQVPGQGFPDETDGTRLMRYGGPTGGGMRSGMPGGEWILSFAIRKEEERHWLVIDVRNDDTGQGGRLRGVLHRNGGTWPDGDYGISTGGPVKNAAQPLSSDAPLLLMRQRYGKRSISTLGPPEAGLMIWVEVLAE